MIEQLVSRVFADRNHAHIAHWVARGPGSYARHVALGDFYDSVIDSVDSIVEAYQGAFDLIGEITLTAAEGDILASLEVSADWIEMNRDKICKLNSAVGNLVDTLLENYYSTIYKLRNLQ